MSFNLARKPKRAKGSPKEKKSKLGLWTALILLVLVASYLLVIDMSRPKVGGDKLRLDTVINYIETGRIKDARLLDQDSYIVGTYDARPSDPAAGDPATAPPDPNSPPVLRRYNGPLLSGATGTLVQLLLVNKVPITVDQQVKKRVGTLAATLLPGLAIIVLIGYMVMSAKRGTGLFAVRSGARSILPDPASGVRFSDIAGQEAALTELREVQQFISNPDLFADLGASVPKGVLLYGPPGCGKTMLAKALANESEATFYSISGSDFMEMYVGVGASRVRDLFKEARNNAPAIIFIDELDSIGRSRSGGAGVTSVGEQEQTLNAILTEMDGFSPSDGLVVVAATNRPDILDPALLRPGRFDRPIGLALPGEEARLQILKTHARNKRLEGGASLAPIATRAIGMTGADLANVMNEAALLAGRAGHTKISQTDLDAALQRVVEAPDRQRKLSLRNKGIGRRFTEEERMTFADIAGQDDAVAELAEIKEFLTDPKRFAAMGATVPKGILLYGPPGCGKTRLARALAGEANAAFFSVSGSDFVEVLVGQGASRVRDTFAEARSAAPAIIFIDEIDAVGSARGKVGVTQSHGEHDQTLTQILAEMDGFSTTEGVIVIGATNRPDIIDRALMRPGRFDRTVGLALPDEKAREKILLLHAEGKNLGADVDLAAIAERAIGLSGADLANVLNEAALLAVRSSSESISQATLDVALQRILSAPERQRRLSMRERSVGKRFSSDQRVTFADVAGVDDAIEELAEVRDYLADTERFAKAGAKVPRGVLLVGPPGCGKTLLARAVAGEANAAFLSVSGSEFVEVYVGEGASRVRELFADARSMAPAIIFIDEIDAVGGHRSSSSNSEREQTLNQMLVELDGFEPSNSVIVMAATNRPDMLDSALLRPGRFDRQVTITLPDRTGRKAILELKSKDKNLAPDANLDGLAGVTQGLSGAELANILNEAALLSVRRGGGPITMEVLDEAVDRALLGITSRRALATNEERRLIAYHEAGHALVALVRPGTAPPHRLTVVPRGDSLGHCTVGDGQDRLVHSRSALLDVMASALGGRLAEQMIFGEVSSGAASDLTAANKLAYRMVCELGMSETLGPRSYSDAGAVARWSNEAATAVDAEVGKLLEEAGALGKEALAVHRDGLYRLAEALLERETLTADEIRELVGAGGSTNGSAGESAIGAVGTTDGTEPARPVAASGSGVEAGSQASHQPFRPLSTSRG